MTMTGTDERRLNLKPHCTAEATPTDFLAHGSALLQRHPCIATAIATV
jgi:hypothetical protein